MNGKDAPLILIFGENQNDTTALRTLIRHLHENCSVQIRRDPPVLSRGADRPKRGTMAERMAAFADAEAARRPRVIVIAHRDCDDVEPAHLENAVQLETDMRAAGIQCPVAACPAWEIEAWWMLFPEALAQVRACWRQVNYQNRSVGMIGNAKEQLTRDLRPTGHRAAKCPDYTESDSPRIAEEIVRSGHLQARLNGSASLRQFANRLEAALA